MNLGAEQGHHHMSITTLKAYKQVDFQLVEKHQWLDESDKGVDAQHVFGLVLDPFSHRFSTTATEYQNKASYGVEIVTTCENNSEYPNTQYAWHSEISAWSLN